MNPNHPTSFLGAPGYGPAQHPGPTPPTPFVGAPSPAVAQVPTLTVRPNGDVTITKALLAQLPQLKGGSPINLVPPRKKGFGGIWHLDTRSNAPCRLPDSRKPARFSIPPPSRNQFKITVNKAGPGRGHSGGGGGAQQRLDVPRLVFRLGPEEMEEICLTDRWGQPVCSMRGTGYYELIPVRETM